MAREVFPPERTERFSEICLGSTESEWKELTILKLGGRELG